MVDIRFCYIVRRKKGKIINHSLRVFGFPFSQSGVFQLVLLPTRMKHRLSSLHGAHESNSMLEGRLRLY